MEISQFQLLSVMLGAFIGMLMALTGAGGSILAVPLLMFGLHLGLLQAAPIGLLAVMLAAGLAAFMGLRAGIVRYKAASLLAASGLLIAPLGVWLAHQISNKLLSAVFAMVLIYVAIHMFLKARHAILHETADCVSANQPCQINKQVGRISWNAPCARAMALSGAIAGFFSGLLGVGGGFVVVPALHKFTDLDMRSIVATSLTAITLVSAFSVLIYAANGMIAWHLALPFVVGAVAGMLSGRLLEKRLKGPHLQQAFAVLAFAIAIFLLMKY